MIFISFALLCVLVHFARRAYFGNVGKYSGGWEYLKNPEVVCMPSPTLSVNSSVIYELKENVDLEADEEEDTNHCSLCLEQLTNDQTLCKFACEHEFHATCAMAWSVKADRCPFCSARLDSGVPLTSSEVVVDSSMSMAPEVVVM